MTDLAAWRARSVFAFLWWTPASADANCRVWQCLENRRVLLPNGMLTRRSAIVAEHDDRLDRATCMGCGCEFHHEEPGGCPDGIVACSPECVERYEISALVHCCDCGGPRPVHIREPDEHICSVCASRAMRARITDLLGIDVDTARDLGRAHGLLPAATPGDDGATGCIWEASS